MNASNIEILNTEFAFDDDNQSVLFIADPAGIPQVKLKNVSAECLISLQGAQIISWIPKGQEEVIWVSPAAKYVAGKSLRGGVPICWPWFGAHRTHDDYPAHGFARNLIWEVKAVKALSAEKTRICFALDCTQLDQNIRAMWPHNARVEFCVTISDHLTMELTSFNDGDETIEISEALHTYFDISDIRQTKVQGLDGKDYLDKTEGFKRKAQVGDITIASEVDRVYLDTADDVIIDNQKRKILIRKQGSQSTVVWNPWEDAANNMGDMSKDGYLEMLCVESANAADNTVSIAAGESHRLLVSYEISQN